MPTSTTAARTFLKMNGLFSILTAVPLLLAAGLVAPVLFADPVVWLALGLRGLGAGRVGFAVLVYAVSQYKFVSRAMVNEIVLLDVLWVLGSIALIAFFGHLLTANGTLIVAAVAAAVAFIAISQFVSAARIVKPIPGANVEMRDGKLRATVKRPCARPPRRSGM